MIGAPRIMTYLLLTLGFLPAWPLLAQIPPSPSGTMTPPVPTASPSGESVGNSTPPAATGPTTNAKTKDDFQWVPPPLRTFSARERQAECRKFEGKLIAYYSHLYLVENCKRREVEEGDQIHVNSMDKVTTVDADTIIKLAEGKPFGEDHKFPAKKRGCKALEGKLILEGASDIYLVENCRRRAFADYETFEAYTAKHKTAGAVLEVSPEEFAAIKPGKEIPSILDGVYKNLLEGGDSNVDLIPVDEACRGVNGRIISFYSRLYKVEHCRKREINPQKFFGKRGNDHVKIIEMSASQWLSLPDGKPMDDLEQVD